MFSEKAISEDWVLILPIGQTGRRTGHHIEIFQVLVVIRYLYKTG